VTPLLLVLALAAPPDVVSLPPTDAQKAFDALFWEMQQQMRDRPKEDADKHFDAISREYLVKFEDHLSKHPNDPSAVTALLNIAAYSRNRDPAQHDRAVARLRKEYVHTPLVVPSLRNLGLRQNEFERELLHEIGDRNESARVRALAWRALINGRESYISLHRAVPNLTDSQRADIAAWEKDIAFAREKLAGADLRGAIADLSPGSPAPALAAVDLDGRKVDLADYKGKVVVVDFWHTHCGPCVRMIPRANELIQEMKDKPFVHLGVSVDETRDAVREFHKKTEQLGVHGWVGWNSPALEVWNVEAYPTIFLVDHRGVIRHHQLGSADYGDVARGLVKKAVDDK